MATVEDLTINTESFVEQTLALLPANYGPNVRAVVRAIATALADEFNVYAKKLAEHVLETADRPW